MNQLITDCKERIADELEELIDRGTWCLNCVEAAYCMVKTWKYLCEIEKMENSK